MCPSTCAVLGVVLSFSCAAFKPDHLHSHAPPLRVQYLGRKGRCVVDETEKGWYIQWIDRDPAAIARQEQLAQKKQSDQVRKRERERERRPLPFACAVLYDVCCGVTSCT